jgi:hypothetical protein
MPSRDKEGKFVKGVSGNKSGRPKSAKLTQKDRDELVKIVKDNVKDENLLSEMLSFMLQRAEFITDVHKYLKEYAPFLAPKLSSIKQEIEQETTITIQIEGFEDINMIDKTPEKGQIEADLIDKPQINTSKKRDKVSNKAAEDEDGRR